MHIYEFSLLSKLLYKRYLATLQANGNVNVHNRDKYGNVCDYISAEFEGCGIKKSVFARNVPQAIAFLWYHCASTIKHHSLLSSQLKAIGSSNEIEVIDVEVVDDALPHLQQGALEYHG